MVNTTQLSVEKIKEKKPYPDYFYTPK